MKKYGLTLSLLLAALVYISLSLVPVAAVDNCTCDARQPGCTPGIARFVRWENTDDFELNWVYSGPCQDFYNIRFGVVGQKETQVEIKPGHPCVVVPGFPSNCGFRFKGDPGKPHFAEVQACVSRFLQRSSCTPWSRTAFANVQQVPPPEPTPDPCKNVSPPAAPKNCRLGPRGANCGFADIECDAPLPQADDIKVRAIGMSFSPVFVYSPWGRIDVEYTGEGRANVTVCASNRCGDKVLESCSNQFPVTFGPAICTGGGVPPEFRCPAGKVRCGALCKPISECKFPQ